MTVENCRAQNIKGYNLAEDARTSTNSIAHKKNFTYYKKGSTNIITNSKPCQVPLHKAFLLITKFEKE